MGDGRKANFLDYVPRRKLESTLDEGGQRVLLLPKFGQGRIARWWVSVIGERRATLKIHLDEMGSRTWDAIDGRRSIAEIADHVQQLCGSAVQERYERCSRFIKMLSNAGAVDLSTPGKS